MANKKGTKRYFGNVKQLPSGRFHARYTGPDGRTYNGPKTFDGKGDAEAWLSLRQAEILRNTWLPPDKPKPAPVTLRSYADAWLADRELAERTREEYAALLRDHVYPTLGKLPIASITPHDVRLWHAALKTGPTRKSHAYGLLRTIMGTAVAEEVRDANPCRIRGAGSHKRARHIRPATLPELQALMDATPPRYRLMILLGAWTALRFGELTELRRSDVDANQGTIRVRRAVARTKDGSVVKAPKSDAGSRDVAVPPHIIPAIQAHLAEHATKGSDGLVFPARQGGHMAHSALYKVYTRARREAGRPDLRFHDLRHTGAVLAASTGATLAELMARLGHSTPAAAMVYQHVAQDRDKVIASALSDLVKPH